MAYKDVEDRRRYAREYHKQRMQTDPQYAEEYRAKKLAYRNKRCAEDPEYRKRLNATANKWSTTPEGKAYRVAQTKKRTETGYYRQYMGEKRQDPEFRAKEAAKMRERRAANPDYHKAILKRCREKVKRERPHLFRHQRLKHYYGMSPEEYERRFTAQNGKCAICFGDNKGKLLVVDHDHNKPKGEGNRWLLCGLCNIMIGVARENPAILRRAADLLGDYFGGTGHSC